MRILVLTHGYPPRDHGGSQLYAQAHAEAFVRAGDSVLVVAREADASRTEFAVRRERRDGYDVAWVNNTFARVRSTKDLYTDDRIDAVVVALAEAFAPDVAHVHHLTCLSTTIVPALATRGVPVFMTLHDYWLICHRGQLLDTSPCPAMQACAGPEPSGCAGCLGAAAAPAPAFAARALAGRRLPRLVGRVLRGPIVRALGVAAAAGAGRAASAARLAHMRAIAGQVTRFFAPSRHVRDRFVAFGVNPSRITVSEYGWTLPPRAAGDPAGYGADPGVALQIGFIGSLMASKAPHVLLEAAGRLPEGSVRVHVFGEPAPYHGDDSYLATLAPLLARPYVRRHGRLHRDGLRAALRGLHALVVSSVWQENSPLVIREAFLAGVPVIASRVGGIPETVTDGVNGLLVAPGEVDDLYRALARLVAQPGLLARLRAGIAPVRSLDDDVGTMREAYAQVRGQSAPTTVPTIAAVVLNYRTPDDTVLAVRSVLRSRRPLTEVIVVDNDEVESCRAALAPLGERVTYLHAGCNLGYSGGMNLGIRAALAGGADLVLLLNSDVIVPTGAVGALEQALAASPGAGIAGPVVLSRQAPDRIATRGMHYVPATGRMRHHGVGQTFVDGALAPTTVVAGVSGCCLLVRREVLDATGGFDEAYFFGFEDLDLCLRARDVGFTTIVAGAATVLHEGRRSIGAASPARLYFAARNHLRLAATRSRTRLAGRMARAVAVIALNVAHAVRDGQGSTFARLAAVLRGTGDHLRGAYGPAPHDLATSRDAGPASHDRVAP
jgi:GT2 family glycosyltransferase/glycosyltransferase involved in cell wall biosynthesis